MLYSDAFFSAAGCPFTDVSLVIMSFYVDVCCPVSLEIVLMLKCLWNCQVYLKCGTSLQKHRFNIPNSIIPVPAVTVVSPAAAGPFLKGQKYCLGLSEPQIGHGENT